MADFPATIYAPRILTNRPGANYDALNTKVLFSEDWTKLSQEIQAIENYSGRFSKLFFGGYVPQFRRVVGVNLVAGEHDLYTVPAGKKAFVNALTIRGNNNGSSSLTVFAYVDFGSGNKRISNSQTVSAGNAFSLSSGSIVLNAGQTFGISVSGGDGATIAPSYVYEFEDTAPLSRLDLLAPSSGFNLIKTAPSSQLSASFIAPFNSPTPLVCYVSNHEASSLNVYPANVPSGDTPSSFHKIYQNTVVSVGGFSSVSFYGVIANGDSAYLNFDVSAPNSFVWANIIDLDFF